MYVDEYRYRESLAALTGGTKQVSMMSDEEKIKKNHG